VLWSVAQGGSILVMCLITDVITAAAAAASAARHSTPPHVAAAAAGPHLLLAINRNMLALFLVGNLLTGAVNLSVDTMGIGDDLARLIVACYMTLTCGIAALLDLANTTIKL